MSIGPFTWPAVDDSLSRDSTWSTATALAADPAQTPPPGGWVEEVRDQPGNVTPATAAFTLTPNPAAVDEVVTVDASGSTEGTYPIRDYTWDFGDTGPEIGGETMTHAYTSAGTYTVTLTVTDAAGGTATVSDQLTVA